MHNKNSLRIHCMLILTHPFEFGSGFAFNKRRSEEFALPNREGAGDEGG